MAWPQNDEDDSLAAKPNHLREHPSTTMDIALILRGQANACVELLRQPQGRNTGLATEPILDCVASMEHCNTLTLRLSFIVERVLLRRGCVIRLA